MREIFRRQPKFRPDDGARKRAQVPDDLWRKCPSCGDLIYARELERNLLVCPKCGYHYRLSARQRIDQLADDGSFTEWDAGLRTADPLDFKVGNERYGDKARSTVERAGVSEAVVSGWLMIDDRAFAVVVTDFSFMGASMGSVYGEKLARAAERAVEQGIPLVTISASGGARMQEGMLSLMQMAKTTAALSVLGEARIPHLSIMVDPCYGGVTASYAAVADVVMAEPGARIGFAGPRVIEQVTRQKLPEGFQTAEFLLEHGLIDRVAPRDQIRESLRAFHDLYMNAHTQWAERGVEKETETLPNGVVR